jgi:tryptophan synthase alpha chain
VDGVVLPELPLEESERFAPDLKRNGLSQILLVTPTTEPARIRAVDDACSGFLYCVSTTGVTGGYGRKPEAGYIRDVKRIARRNPVLVGFGITTPDDARRAARDADGVIIGSALIKQIAAGAHSALLTDWVSGFKAALRPDVIPT